MTSAIGGLAAILVLAGVGVVHVIADSSHSTAGRAHTTASGPQRSDPSHAYPPRRSSDLQPLAKMSSVTPTLINVEEISPGCACRVSLLLPSGLNGRQQLAALLAYVFDRKLITLATKYNDGMAVVFGYTDQSQFGSGFTAGQVDLDVTESRTITVDTGDGGVSLGK